MKVCDTVIDTLKQVHQDLTVHNIDYRFTGLTATNLYGYGITTNCIDIAVANDDIALDVAAALGLPTKGAHEFILEHGLYAWRHDPPTEFWVRIQGDILGEPFIHPIGVHLHSKALLLRRLEIYSKYDAVVLKACAFIALTLDEDKTARYKEYWNRL